MKGLKSISFLASVVLTTLLLSGCEGSKKEKTLTSDGEAIFVDPQGGKVWNIFGLQIIGKILSEDTDGRYAVIVSHTPVNGGPPLHIHENEEEVFYILEGTFEFVAGDQKTIAEKGSVISLPKNLAHSFRNIGDSTGVTLNTITPGGLEKFFDEIDALPKDAPPDPKIVSDIALKYKLRFLRGSASNN